jgi:hypothetical protein
VDLRLWLIQSAANWGFEFECLAVRGAGFVRLKPDLLGCSCVAEAAFFGAVDLNDDTVLHNDVHRSESQSAERVANLIDRVIGRGCLLGDR